MEGKARSAYRGGGRYEGFWWTLLDVEMRLLLRKGVNEYCIDNLVYIEIREKLEKKTLL